MKAFIFGLIISSHCLLSAQPDNKHSVFLTTGLVDYFYEERKNNFSIGLTYQYRPFKAFSFDGFYLYSQSNSFPSFFDDKNRLNDYILSQNVSSFNFLGWSEVYTHSLGIRVHYSMINTNKWHLSLNFAYGFSFSKSARQSYKWFSWHPVTGQIIDYELADLFEGSISGTFASPGLQLHFNVYKDFMIGINPSLIYFLPDDVERTTTNGTPIVIPLNSAPILPDFISLAIMIGKKL